MEQNNIVSSLRDNGISNFMTDTSHELINEIPIFSVENAKKYRDELKSNFELQTKISILTAQGKTEEADSLRFAKERNSLMEKYGYSLKEATNIQRTIDEVDAINRGEGTVKYSEEAIKSAQRVLDRGEGGTVGKRTIEEAEAVVQGRYLEDGFKTAMFSNLTADKDIGSLNTTKIDSKIERERLDSAANMMREDVNSNDQIITKDDINSLKDLLQKISNNTAASAIPRGSNN